MKRNKYLRKLMCAVLACALCFSCIPTFAADEPTIIYGQTFELVPINSVPDGFVVSGEKARVLRTEKYGKLFQVMKGGKTTVSIPAGTDAKKFYIELKIGAEECANAAVAIGNTGAACELIKIEDNTVKTTEGKVLSTVAANGSGIQKPLTVIGVAVNLKKDTFSVYVDGKMCVQDWKLKTKVKMEQLLVTKQEDKQNSLYLDDLFLYDGTYTPQRVMQGVYPEPYAQGGASDEAGEEFFSFVDDIGDYTFFHSSWPGYNKFPTSIKFYPKTNEITSERFDYKNPEKGDKLLFIKKTTDDAYIDINMKIFNSYKSQRQYKYFKLTGEFMANFDSDPTAHIFMLRDSTSSSSTINEYPIKIEGGRTVAISGTSGFQNAAGNQNCFKITMYLNLEDGTNTIFFGTGSDWKYSNYRMVAKEVKLTSKIKDLSLVRIACGTGAFTGELQCRNVEITGFAKPFVVDGDTVTEEDTSIFDFDANIAEDLEGKILFHYLSNAAFSDGTKYKLAEPGIYENDEFYITADAFNKAYGTQLSVSGNTIQWNGKHYTAQSVKESATGAVLLPLKETVKEILDYHVFDDGDGLIVTSKAKIYYDKDKEIPYHKRYTPQNSYADTYRYVDRQSNLQYLNDYMLFDRPAGAELLEGYRKKMADGAHYTSVLASDADFERIAVLAKTDAYMKALVDDLIAQADVTLKEKILTYKFDDSQRMLNTARKLESRMQLVGFAYRITGEEKYAQYALDQLLALKNYPDLNPPHYIDSGSFGTGIAVAYDWCYDYFTPAQREEIEAQVYRLFLAVFPAAFYGRIPARSATNADITIISPTVSLKWYSNFNTWVNAGGICMAAAFMDAFPEICSDYMSNTIRSLEYTMKNLYPDGGWVESSNYWYHVSRSLMYACGTLENIYGTEFNLLSFPGCDVTGITNMAIRGMVMNYNYHDASGEKIYASHPMGYFGKFFNQRELLAARRATIEKAFDSRMGDVVTYVADALYYDPTVQVNEIDKMPKVYYSEGVELFSVHGDYKDYDALFFASHGGPTTFYHSHNDNGDFTFDLNGVRWAYTLGAEDYNSTLAESAKYRKRTEGHNTVVINNNEDYNQAENRYTPVIAYEEGTGGGYCVYDMTETYGTNVKDYKRGFYIGDNFKTLTVRDEIELAKDNSEIYWFMHTTADAKVLDDRTVILSSNGEALSVQFETNVQDAKVSIMEAEPLPTSPQGEGQTKNAGVRKIAIKINASGKVELAVRLGEFAAQVMQTPIAAWTAPELTRETFDTSDYGFSAIVYGERVAPLDYIPVVVGMQLPEVQVIPNDPTKHAEYIKSESVGEANIVRIYNADRSLSKAFIVPYDTQRGTKEMMFNELEIKDLSVSDAPEAQNQGVNMIDNDFATRWTTLTRGEYATFDLGAVQSIDAVAIGFWQSLVRSYTFDLYSSTDGVNYTFIDTCVSTSGPEEYQVFSMNRIQARYIKLVGHGSTANGNTNVLEFRALKFNEKFEAIRYGK